MKINDVFILEEAVDDMDEGKDFYNLREFGVVAVLPMRRDPAWIVEQIGNRR